MIILWRLTSSGLACRQPAILFKTILINIFRSETTGKYSAIVQIRTAMHLLVLRSDPYPWDTLASSAFQGRYRPIEGTTGLLGHHKHIKAPTYRGHYRCIRGITELSEAL